MVLVANLLLVAALGTLAARAPDRLAVAGGLGADGGATFVVAATAKPSLGEAVTGDSVTVIRSGISADPLVAQVERSPADGGERASILIVELAEAGALERQQAVERIAAAIDPGPLEIALGGEAVAQAAARDEVEDELGRLALLATPLVAVVLLFAFGLRHAPAPLLAGATGALGGIAVLGLAAGSIDLAAVGLPVAAVVGLAIGIESCVLIRRRFAELPAAGPEATLAETLRRAAPVVGIAVGAGALASLAGLAIDLPAARSAAIGGAAAAILAAASAMVATPSVLALSPRPAGEGATDEGRRATSTEPGSRAGRLASFITARPWLGWLPSLLVIAALGIAAAHAFELDATAQSASELTDPEPARAAKLARAEGARVPSGVLSAGPAGLEAEEEIAAGMPIVAVLLTALGLIAGFGAGRSPRAAIATGIAAALPALAVCGLLRMAGKGTLPLGIDLGGGEPHASAFLAAVAAVGSVSVARAALADPGAALAGTLVAGGLVAVLAGSELDGVAQTGIAIAAGLVVDLVLIRAVLAPALASALPSRRPRLRLPGPPRPRLPRLPSRLRR